MDSVRLAYPFPYPCDTLKFAPGRSYVDSTGMLYVWLPPGETPFGHVWNITLKNGIWLLPIPGRPRQRYVVVEGFVSQNFGLNGAAITSDFVHLFHILSKDNGRAGIAVTFCNHVLVENCEAAENGKGIGFTQGMTAYKIFGKDVVFRGNSSHNNYDGTDPNHCGTDGSGFVLDTCSPDAGALFENNIAYDNMGAPDLACTRPPMRS